MEHFNKQIDDYLDAVQADKYTVIIHDPDGIADKSKALFDNPSTGDIFFKREDFTSDVRIDIFTKCGLKKGQDSFIKPESYGFKYLVVNGLTSKSCAKMIDDGYLPTAWIQTGLGTFQGLFTVRDPDVQRPDVATLKEKLEKSLTDKYGEWQSGWPTGYCWFPGTYNHQKESKLANDDYAPVMLRKSSKRLCLKGSNELANLSKQRWDTGLNTDTDGTYALTPDPAPFLSMETLPEYAETEKANAAALANAAYVIHAMDIANAYPQNLNFKTMDNMIAQRMFMTGHAYDFIVEAIRKHTRVFGAGNDYSYAVRTADHASSTYGAILKPSVKRWKIALWRNMEHDFLDDPENADKIIKHKTTKPRISRSNS
jgi:hypothetical protein